MPPAPLADAMRFSPAAEGSLLSAMLLGLKIGPWLEGPKSPVARSELQHNWRELTLVHNEHNLEAMATAARKGKWWQEERKGKAGGKVATK